MSEKREWEKHMSDKNDTSDKTHMNIWVINVIESDSEKWQFCEFLRGWKGFHHWNDNFCSKIFVFHMENLSCDYIWLGSVQMMLLMMVMMLLILMIWKVYCDSVFEKIISLLEVTFFQNVEMITSAISAHEGGSI